MLRTITNIVEIVTGLLIGVIFIKGLKGQTIKKDYALTIILLFSSLSNMLKGNFKHPSGLELIKYLIFGGGLVLNIIYMVRKKKHV